MYSINGDEKMPRKKRFSYVKAMKEYKAGRDLVGIVQRQGGGKTQYQKMYNWVKFGKRPIKRKK